uniref:Ovule protein n=1 Tax=Ascaris lumbricoides TaxID=6252 RepID=A0A0M3HI12_ASCLU
SSKETLIYRLLIYCNRTSTPPPLQILQHSSILIYFSPHCILSCGVYKQKKRVFSYVCHIYKGV